MLLTAETNARNKKINCRIYSGSIRYAQTFIIIHNNL